MTPLQIKLIRSALGLPNDRRLSYRNRYYAPKGSDQEKAWDDLVSLGLAERGSRNRSIVGYCLTHSGAALALEPSESLCTEDFPEALLPSTPNREDAGT